MSYPTSNFVVYMHTNKINNKKYIGITQQKVKKRWQNGEGYIRSPLFYRAIKKYSWNNFRHEILFKDLTKEVACKKEVELINFYKANQREFGYNISGGGECSWYGLHHSDETKKKMSLAKSNMSEETKQKMRQSLKGKHSGKNNNMYGKSGCHSPVAIKVICLDNFITYESILDAARNLSINANHISTVCKNKQNKTGGYRFMYLSDYDKLI